MIGNMAKMRELEPLDALLQQAEDKDLGVLADYITNNGKGRLSVEDTVCAQLVDCRIADEFGHEDRALIASEISKFGGNSIANFFRKKGVDYSELVWDVAKHLKAEVAADAFVADMESAILRTLLKKSVERMSESERANFEKSMFDSGLVKGETFGDKVANWADINSLGISAIVAVIFAQQLVRGGLVVGADAFLAPAIGIAFGPVAWIAVGVWSLADLASPAYRVTVPCVVQIAFMRQKLLKAAPPPVIFST